MKVEKQYDTGGMAKEYAASSIKNESLDPGRQFVRAYVAGLGRSAKLLDVGCGSGLDLKAYEDMGFIHLYGVDPSQKLLDEAAGTTKAALSLGTFEKLPFDDNSFDVIVSRHALHYVEDISRSWQEVARVLKPGGGLAVVMSHPLADALEKKDSNGHVTTTLFKGSISITFPQRSFSDYFSDEFLRLFKLVHFAEYVGAERDSQQGVPNALCFVATKQ